MNYTHDTNSIHNLTKQNLFYDHITLQYYITLHYMYIIINIYNYIYIYTNHTYVANKKMAILGGQLLLSKFHIQCREDPGGIFGMILVLNG